MEINRDLLNPDFECYKLLLCNDDSIKYLPLNSKCKSNENDGNVEFEVLADWIYENKLKRSDNKFYYLSEECDLVCISKEEKKTLKISGPFECFCVSKQDGVVFCAKDKNLIMINDSDTRIFELDLELDGIKILEVKSVEGTIHLILQQLSKVKNMKNGEKYSKLLDKTAFCFYNVVIDGQGIKYDLIGWSLSRPLVSYIRDTGEILLGTSTGIIIDSMNNSEKTDAIETSEVIESIYEDYDSEDEDCSSSCRIFEFRNNKFIYQYPEIRISGSSVNDLKVAAKYLEDVVIFDLTSTGETMHLTTFPALNFIQSGKIDKKFSLFGKGFAYIIETNGNIFCYTKPVNKNQITSSQSLLQMDEEIYGWAHEIEGNYEILFILTKEKLYELKFELNL